MLKLNRSVVSTTLFVVLILLAFASCSRPEGVLSSSKMEDVLYDIHMADGVLAMKGYQSGHNTEGGKYYESVLQKHGITQAQFDSSLVWYTDNPQRFNKIYPKVITRLENTKSALLALNVDKSDEQRKAEKREAYVRDSIYRAHDLAYWQKILREGLPLQWKRDTIVIDTAFIYPFMEQLQDSVQNAIHNSQHLDNHQQNETLQDDQQNNLSPILNRRFRALEKGNLRKNHNILDPK